MDTARYVLALLSLVTYPAAVSWWWLVHPFVGFWRRLGPALSFALLTIYAVAVIAILYHFRKPLLAVEFGTNRYLVLLAMALYGGSLYVEIRARKHLKARVLTGVPELAPDRPGGRVLTEGIYGQIRHPRYVAVTLGTFAVAFFTNYLAVYVIALLMIPGLYSVVVLEERELRDRFGEEYIRYAERVPRFFPRRRSPGTGQRER